MRIIWWISILINMVGIKRQNCCIVDKLTPSSTKGRKSRHVSTMAFLIKNGRISLKSFVGGACIVFVPWISHLGSSWQYLYTDFWLYLLLLYIILYNGALVLCSFITTGGIQSEFYKVFCILNSENKQYMKNKTTYKTRTCIRDAIDFHLSNTHINSCFTMWQPFDLLSWTIIFSHIVKFCILLYMHILTGGCSRGLPGTDFWTWISHQLLSNHYEPFRLVLDGSQFLPFLWVSHHSSYQPLLPNSWLLPVGPQQGVQDGSSGQLARVLFRVVYSTRYWSSDYSTVCISHTLKS